MDNELYHYGVLGMKWGVRRYQPYSVKPRGSGEGGKEIGAAAKAKKLSNRDKKAAVKNVHNLSDEELKKRIRRLQNENKLRDLTEENLRPGKNKTKEVMTKIGISVASGILVAYGKKILNI